MTVDFDIVQQHLTENPTVAEWTRALRLGTTSSSMEDMIYQWMEIRDRAPVGSSAYNRMEAAMLYATKRFVIAHGATSDELQTLEQRLEEVWMSDYRAPP